MLNIIMKLAIYGDSFAEINPPRIEHSWQQLLANKLNCSMNCYGLNSSSIFYSYRKFLETYSNYDIIVFLVTEPNRYAKTFHISSTNENIFVSNVFAIDYVKKNFKLTWEENKHLDKFYNYFDIMDEEYHNEASDCMLHRMDSLHSKIIFYPCFSNSYNAARWQSSGLDPKFSLYNFVISGWKAFGYDEHFGVHRENPETTNSHLTPEHNIFLSELLYQKIQSNVWNFTNFDSIKLNKPFNYYYL